MTERTFQKRVLDPVHVDSLDTQLDTWAFVRAPLETDAPDGRLVFLHGLGDAPVTWFACLRHAFPRHELVLPALPGAGRGPLPPGHDHVSNKATTEWYAAVVDRLAANADTISDIPTRIIGHSLGGWITMRALVEHPDLERHVGAPVLVNTAGTWYEGVERERDLLSPKQLEDVDELLSHLYANPPNMPPVAMQALLDTMHAPSYRGLLWSTTKRDFLVPETLARLPTGTGIVWGTADTLVPPLALETLEAHVRDVRIERIPDCGHAPHLEAPTALVAALGRLLDISQPGA